jgi:hypothetical protein
MPYMHYISQVIITIFCPLEQLVIIFAICSLPEDFFKPNSPMK